MGLDRPIHRPEGALADLFQQPIAPQRFPLQLQGGVVSQNLLVQALQGRGRVDPKLLGQGLPGLLVGPECLGLPARPVQRQQALAPQPLSQRLLLGEPLQLGHDLAVAAED
jgi:hypothetical protein